MNWKVREGLHGLIGKMKLPGTALIVEDVCVRPERIAEAAEEIRALTRRVSELNDSVSKMVQRQLAAQPKKPAKRARRQVAAKPGRARAQRSKTAG